MFVSAKSSTLQLQGQSSLILCIVVIFFGISPWPPSLSIYPPHPYIHPSVPISLLLLHFVSLTHKYIYIHIYQTSLSLSNLFIYFDFFFLFMDDCYFCVNVDDRVIELLFFLSFIISLRRVFVASFLAVFFSSLTSRYQYRHSILPFFFFLSPLLPFHSFFLSVRAVFFFFLFF